MALHHLEYRLAIRQVENFVRARRDYYIKQARRITTVGRDLTRVHGRFATIYAAGSLAIEYGVFPYSRKQLLDALLTCERDHVDFIAREMAPLHHVVAATPDSPEVRLERYLEDNQARFIENGGDLPRNFDHKACPGYLGTHGGEKEIWLNNKRFEAIAGTKADARLLKEVLLKQGRLGPGHRGAGLNYTVRRNSPGFGRDYVVALKSATVA